MLPTLHPIAETRPMPSDKASASPPLSDQERLDFLRLARSDHVGPVTFRRLIAMFASPSEALSALPDLARRGGRRGLRPCDEAQAIKELESLRKAGGQAIILGESEYPAPLAEIADPPPVLSVLGKPESLHRRAIGIVGSRRASAAGCRFANGLASDLSAAGLLTVSGLARGIDTEAHKGSLDGGTVAVVAGGLDQIYPPENKALFQRIQETGAIITEQPWGREPQGKFFPRRNRIIAGLSLGVVIVEATMRSGSLITARLAAEQGREVFAVPGFPSDPRHTGTNKLIREGATLTESARDILDVIETFGRIPAFDNNSSILAESAETHEFDPSAIDGDARENIVSALSPTPVSVDELIRQCQVTPAMMMTVLLELDLAGRLNRDAGGRISLVS